VPLATGAQTTLGLHFIVSVSENLSIGVQGKQLRVKVRFPELLNDIDIESAGANHFYHDRAGARCRLITSCRALLRIPNTPVAFYLLVQFVQFVPSHWDE